MRVRKTLLTAAIDTPIHPTLFDLLSDHLRNGGKAVYLLTNKLPIAVRKSWSQHPGIKEAEKDGRLVIVDGCSSLLSRSGIRGREALEAMYGDALLAAERMGRQKTTVVVDSMCSLLVAYEGDVVATTGQFLEEARSRGLSTTVAMSTWASDERTRDELREQFDEIIIVEGHE